MQNLLQYISEKAFITPELKSRIISDFQLLETQKNEIILSEDNRASYLYFIEKGVLHNYYYHEGRQVSSWFYVENQFITAWYSFYAQNPSFETIECLEDCVLYRVSYTDYQKLIADFPAFGN